MSIAGPISLSLNNNDSKLSTHSSLATLIESVNDNNLSFHYSNSNSLFKQKIDKLNLQFYIETERILNKKKTLNSDKNSDNDSQCKDNLFLLLFKQINLYVAEIDRLNCLLKECNENAHLLFKEKKAEKMKRRNEISTKDKIISTLRASIVVLEESLVSQLKQTANGTPCFANMDNVGPPIELSIGTYSFNIIATTNNKRRRGENAIGRNGNSNQNESIVIDGSMIQSNKKQLLTNEFIMKQYSNDDYKQSEFNYGLNFQILNQRKNNNCLALNKKSKIKIIKELKETVSKFKADTNNLISRENSENNIKNSYKNRSKTNRKINDLKHQTQEINHKRVWIWK